MNTHRFLVNQPILLMILNLKVTDEDRSPYENVRTNKKLQVGKFLWVWFRVFVCLVHFVWESHEELLQAGNFHNPSLTKHGYSMNLAHCSSPGKGLHVPPGPGQCSWQMLCDTHSLQWVISCRPKVPGVCGLEHSSVQRQPGDCWRLSNHRFCFLLILLSGRKFTHTLF